MSKALTAIAVIKSAPISAQKEVSFPVLAKNISTGDIVLFRSPTEGTVLLGGKNVVVGVYLATWSKFHDGLEWKILPPGTEIILSNKEE